MRVRAQAPAEMYADLADAEVALTALYDAHYRALVRVAVLLVGCGATAEQIVQESFAAMNANACPQWNTGRALSHLRAAVVSRSRSASRHHIVAQATTSSAPDMAVATWGELVPPEQAAVMAALQKLPNRQREVVVLRCYCDLSDAQIAATIGISTRTVKRNAARGMAALRPVLEGDS